MCNQPNFENYHKSIAEELNAVKDKIRNLVSHWPTDGAWKEIALRNILRKHLPESCMVGHGFIVGKDKVSSQIDILIASKNQPTLFKDGDLLIVTPNAVRAIVEVKTNLKNANSIKAFEKLAHNDSLCKEYKNQNVWTGIFDFDGKHDDGFCKRLLKTLKSVNESEHVPINCISCGSDLFIRYWKSGSRNDSTENLWRSYQIAKLAPAYFIGNLINHIASITNSSSSFAWFPIEGTKETYKTYEMNDTAEEPRNLQMG
ncbi:MAG: DUF6602 domain-containing protein [Sedimentisphaerales bacterium]